MPNMRPQLDRSSQLNTQFFISAQQTLKEANMSQQSAFFKTKNN